MVSVTLKNITKRFGDVIALKNISFKADDNKIVTLLGPSGCGKTTTLRIIAGFTTPDSGDVLFDNRSVINDPPQKRNIGFVFQNIALFPHMTAFDNISFGLETRNWSKEKIKLRVKELAEMLHIESLLTRYPRELSVGQQQRVAIARALAPNPDVLLLDEPLSALDINLRDELRLEIKRIQKTLGTTMIYVTHDLSDAFSIGDKIVILNNGEIQQIGTPYEIYFNPKTEFVAKFLQVTNFFEGTIISIENKFAKVDVNGHIFLIECKQNFVKKEKITFIVRPEDFMINPIKSLENIFEVTIDSFNFKGSFVEINATFESMMLKILTTSKEIIPLLVKGTKLKVGFSPKVISIIQNS